MVGNFGKADWLFFSTKQQLKTWLSERTLKKDNSLKIVIVDNEKCAFTFSRNGVHFTQTLAGCLDDNTEEYISIDKFYHDDKSGHFILL